MIKLKYSDTELMEMFRKGKTSAEKAFNFLVEEYSQPLYWSIRRMTKNHEMTNDILQNSWIKIWRNIDCFAEKSSLFTWIYRICKNETFNLLKSEQRHISEHLDQPLFEILPGTSINNKYNSEEISDLLMKAINELPEKQAIVFNLKYFDELKYSEMSEMLGTSEGALKASYSIAVQKIQTYLQEL